MKLMRTLFLMACIGTIIGCNTDELEGEIADLEAQNAQNQTQLNEKEEVIIEFIGDMNEIQANLAKIKEREDIMTARFDNGNVELNSSMKDNIIEDIELINGLLQENKDRMAALNSRLRKSNLKIEELEVMITNLTNQIQAKDAQIADLQTQLAEANEQLKVLFDEYNNRIEELGEQEDKLNTAYYCFGTAKELKEQGVVTKEGGFIGLGKTTKLSDDFNQEYFTKVDISLTGSIDLMTEGAKIITNHPKDSYELIANDDVVEKLVIKDYESFWSSSKYLVIITD